MHAYNSESQSHSKKLFSESREGLSNELFMPTMDLVYAVVTERGKGVLVGVEGLGWG